MKLYGSIEGRFLGKKRIPEHYFMNLRLLVLIVYIILAKYCVRTELDHATFF